MANARMSSDTERLDSRRQDRHLEGERSPQLDESTFQDLVAFADQDQNVSAGRLLNAAPPEIRQIRTFSSASFVDPRRNNWAAHHIARSAPPMRMGCLAGHVDATNTRAHADASGPPLSQCSTSARYTACDITRRRTGDRKSVAWGTSGSER